MFLDRIDIDAHGPLDHVELGPFSEHMNVVCGPEGAGKTAIVRFIRDSLVDREYPLGMMSSSSGRVVWADRNGRVHCRRERDGSAHGRRSIEIESRGHDPFVEGPAHIVGTMHETVGSTHSTVFDSQPAPGRSWLGEYRGNHSHTLAAQSIQLPESIVDGVITDTSVTSVHRVISACIRSGLDNPETYQDLPLDRYASHWGQDGGVWAESLPAGEWAFEEDAQRIGLRRELADVEAELARIQRRPKWSANPTLGATRSLDRRDAPSWGDWDIDSIDREYEALIRRRDDLSAMFATGSSSGPRRRPLEALHLQADQLRHRRYELTRWIESLDEQLASYPDANHRWSRHQTFVDAGRVHSEQWMDDRLRHQLDQLDGEMIRWRRALVEIQGLRQVIIASRDAFRSREDLVFDIDGYHRARRDGFYYAIDHYRHAHRDSTWDWYCDQTFNHHPAYYRLDEIEARIDSATRMVDHLLAGQPSASYGVGNHTLHSNRTLQSIRGELLQLGRCLPHAGLKAPLTPVGHHLTPVGHHFDWFGQDAARLAELERSEAWFSDSIGSIARHREQLLHEHAKQQNIDLANHYDRTRADLASISRERNARFAELRHITTELDHVMRAAADLRYQSRYLPIIDDRGLYRGDSDPWRRWSTSLSEGGYETSGHDGRHVFGFAGEALDRHAEIRQIDHRLAEMSRVRWLRIRREQLRQQLGNVVPVPMKPAAGASSPFAQLSSSWLARLSGGKWTSIAWGRDLKREATATGQGPAAAVVTINGRDESQCSGSVRALATIAIRLAAGELLQQLGRPVPIVLEIHRELTEGTLYAGAVAEDQAPFAEPGRYHQVNDCIASALRDYARGGRQLLMLTSDQGLAAQLSRGGARRYDIHASRVLHAHRPLWQPHYEAERYVGPHPHVHGEHDAAKAHPAGHHRVNQNSVRDANWAFDLAWHENYGSEDARRFSRTDWARENVALRDGYFYADSYTTRSREYETPVAGEFGSFHKEPTFQSAPMGATTSLAAPSSPTFYLSVDSPIDQAPSVDAVAAARLRGLKVTHVTHLMQRDSNRLADALGMTDVDARTIRRWQAECRLACRVPHLRGFDAKVLVGCGIESPAELASTHPVDLLKRVESFLATRQGQQLLLSGSSHELSRLTSWIAAANATNNGELYDSDRYEYVSDDEGEGVLDSVAAGIRGGRMVRRGRPTSRSRRGSSSSRRRSRSLPNTASTRGWRYGIRDGGDDREGLDWEPYDHQDGRGRRSSRSNGSRARNGLSNTRRSSRRSRSDGYGDARDRGRGSGQGAGSGEGRGTRSSRRSQGDSSRSGFRSQRSRYERDPRDLVRYDDEHVEREQEYADREPRIRSERERDTRQRGERQSSEHSSSERELKFYLQRDSPVVDAPSIGSRMASRLEAIGIHTVNDLLTMDAATIAQQLDHRRVDEDTVLQWQQQATLVCRIPMLRGHDAQLLVAAEVTTAEEVAAQDADELFAIIDPIARSSEGKRIVRGGKLPDLEEITEWIGYAQHQRTLQAA